MKQYNVAYRKTLPDGTSYTPTIGKAFEGAKGQITVKLDALPLPRFWKNGELILFITKDEDQ